MNKQLSKKEVWRENISGLIRFLYGFFLFSMYASIVVLSIVYCVQKTSIQEGIQYLSAHKEVLDIYGSVYREGVGELFFILSFIFILMLMLNFILTLWMHLGKSRVASTLFFISALFSFLTHIWNMLMVSNVLNDRVIYRLLGSIFYTIVTFVCMIATYRFHRAWGNAVLKQNEQLSQKVEKEMSSQQFQIAKPKLDHVYYPMKELQKEENHTIKMEQYLNHNEEAGNSIYQNKSVDKENEDALQTVDEKKQQTAVSAAQEEKSGLKDQSNADAEYDSGSRSLLPDREEPNSMLHPSEFENEEKGGATANTEVLMEESDLAKEAVLSHRRMEVLKESETLQEAAGYEDGKGIEPEAIFEPQQEESRGDDEKAETIAAFNSNDTLNSEEHTETYEEHIHEMEDGIKVDTSLGYRRITFEDL